MPLNLSNLTEDMPITGRNRSGSVQGNANDDFNGLAKLSRTQSAPGMLRGRSSSNASTGPGPDESSGRRRSWFRNIGQKLGFESTGGSRGGAGSPPDSRASHSGLRSSSPTGIPSRANGADNNHVAALKSAGSPEFRNPFDYSAAQSWAPAPNLGSSGSASGDGQPPSGRSRLSLRRLSKQSDSERENTPSIRSGKEMPARKLNSQGERKECPVPELAKLPLKRVSFAADVFYNDPPQQIPPMQPDKGNVEFFPDGKLAVSQRQRYSDLSFAPYLDADHADIAREASQRAHDSASRLHQQLQTKRSLLGRLGEFGSHSEEGPEGMADDGDSDPEKMYQNLDIEGQKHVQEFNSEEQEDFDNHQRPTPDVLYTRCCHLREIMPIKTMLKQIKGTKEPIPSLHIVNTKPTMIEVLAFADFLTIVPVTCVNLDALILTPEMVKILLGALIGSKYLSKLTFVNTKLEEPSWSYLSAFLLHNKSLLVLHLCCDFRKPIRVSPFDRSLGDWRLLSRALAARGGIEELDISGTRIASKDLALLLKEGFARGLFLGLAYNTLTHEDLENIQDWVDASAVSSAKLPEGRGLGLRLGGNNLGQEWDIVSKLIKNSRIQRISLRNTQLCADDFVKTFTSEMALQSNLRALDLSENKDLFPAGLDSLVEVLPKFKSLARLELDSCNLSSDGMILLFEAISHCHSLGYLSLMDNSRFSDTAAAALCVAVHGSRSICTVEADTSEWPETLKQQMTKYCIQNLEYTASGNLSENEPEEILSFKEDLAAVTREIDSSKHTLIGNTTIEKVIKLRDNVRERMQALLAKKEYAPLELRDREMLIRLFFWDGSLDRLFRQCARYNGQIPQQAGGVPLSQQVSQQVSQQTLPVKDEAVNQMDALQPSLSRRSSRSSVLSLKKLEHEEAEMHKLNTYLISRPADGPIQEIDNDTLRRAFLEKRADETPAEIISQLRKLHALDLEKIIS